MSSIGMQFRARAREDADVVALRTLDGDELTWREVGARADARSGGLHRLGVSRGDAVALMLNNRPEYVIADLAAQQLGATTFSLYATLPPQQIAPLLTNSGARIALCEGAFLDQILAVRDQLAHVVVLDGAADGTIPWSQVERVEPGLDLDAAAAAVDPDDPAVIIYTSGTTGPPKGVELTSRNLAAGCRAVNGVFGLERGDMLISWLPPAHLFDRLCAVYWPVVLGTTVGFVEDPARIVEGLRAFRPQLWCTVPRVLEKLRPTVAELAPESVPSALGLDRAKAVVSGGAMLMPELAAFFRERGVPLSEVYGMSESAGAGTSSRAQDYVPGTLGRAEESVEIAFGDDGEILIRSDAVMRGYRGDPERTAEALTADGFVRTGDLGRFDADGNLVMTGRKKELIITGGGKNLSPANIEAALKSAGPLIGQACAIGDGRPYITALVVLDAEAAPAWAEANGRGAGRTLGELAAEPVVQAAVAAEVERANAQLARVEQVKRFHLVGGDWLPAGDELTPTMKLKRVQIAQKYAREIEELYAP
jgi:long-chain acyl-CoA synthetase